MSQPTETALQTMITDTAKDIAMTALRSEDLLAITMFLGESEAQPLFDSVSQFISTMYKQGHIDFISANTASGDFAGYVAIIPMGKFAYITRLYVVPELRGNGIALQLLQGADQKYKTITLLCSDDLTGLYEKAGYKNKGYYSQQAKDFSIMDNAFTGLCVMQKNQACKKHNRTLSIFRLYDNDIMPHLLKGIGGVA